MRLAQPPLLPNVTLVFCGLEGFDEMKVRVQLPSPGRLLQHVCMPWVWWLASSTGKQLPPCAADAAAAKRAVIARTRSEPA